MVTASLGRCNPVSLCEYMSYRETGVVTRGLANWSATQRYRVDPIPERTHVDRIYNCDGGVSAYGSARAARKVCRRFMPSAMFSRELA